VSSIHIDVDGKDVAVEEGDTVSEVISKIQKAMDK
jgi:hypothetical protein